MTVQIFSQDPKVPFFFEGTNFLQFFFDLQSHRLITLRTVTQLAVDPDRHGSTRFTTITTITTVDPTADKVQVLCLLGTKVMTIK